MLAAVGAAFAVAKHRHWLDRVPAESRARKAYYSDLVRDMPTAANYKELGKACAECADFEGARVAYADAAKIYRDKQKPSLAYVADCYSQRYEVEVTPYVEVPFDKDATVGLYTNARFEPVSGCYSGAFIDHEDAIRGTYRDEYGAWRRDLGTFNRLTGTHHAIFFMYLGYGRTFPTKFVQHAHDVGAAAQIAFEPASLEHVQDDTYLRSFARAARKSNTPIFLRYASEMNGEWVPYHGDPDAYIEKFRLVAKVMHEEAPNVAMVWCPFETPTAPIPDYYPGPEAVDWVGVNIYSVPYWNNDPAHPAEWRNPADSLRTIYGLYAAKHPIMICEYAASHRTSLDMADRTPFALTKMSEMYAALPRLYPRVKAICWLSMDAIKHAIPGRRCNDYSILEEDSLKTRYRELLNDPYYLQTVSTTPAAAPTRQEPLEDGHTLSGRVPLSAWVKIYDDHPRVVWRVDGDTKYDASHPGPYRWTLDTTTMRPGPATVELIVDDEAGHEVAHVTRHVNIAAR